MKSILKKYVIMLLFLFIIFWCSFSYAFTPDKAIDWCDSQCGQAVEFSDSYNMYQCVDFVLAYMQYLGVDAYQLSGDGKDFINFDVSNTEIFPTRWTILRGNDVIPQKGDILVYDGNSENSHGHVAVYSDEYTTYHQNFLNHPYVEKITEIRYDAFSNPYIGVIRPAWFEMKITAENEYGLVNIEWSEVKGASKYNIVGCNTEENVLERDNQHFRGYLEPGTHEIYIEALDSEGYYIEESNKQIVSISDTNVTFADENFKKYMVSRYDKNNDDMIQYSEIPTQLAIGDNNFEDFEFEDCSILSPKNIDKITSLSIGYCGSINADTFKFFSNIDSIKSLTIGDTKRIDDFNKLLSYFTQVESLDIGSRYYPEYGTSEAYTDDWSALKEYKNLRKISIDIGSFSENDLKSILTSKNTLTELYINKYCSGDCIKDFSSLGDLTNLTSIELEGIYVKDFSFVNKLQNLKYLNIDGNNIEENLVINNNSIEGLTIFMPENNAEKVRIGQANNLKELNLYGDNNGDSEKYLEGNKVYNFNWMDLNNLNSLEKLSIDCFNIPNFDFLDNLRNTRYISFMGIKDAKSLPSLVNLKTLGEIKIVDTELEDISGLADLASTDNSLELLLFWRNKKTDYIEKNNLKLFEILNRKQIRYEIDSDIELPEYTSDKITVSKSVDENGNDINTIRIKHSTQVNKAIIEENFPILKSYDIYVAKPDGTVSKDTTKIGSRDKIEICNTFGEVVKEYTVIVPGDVSGDGEVKIYDAFNILKGTISNTDTSNNIERMIRDYNDDGKVKVYDAFSFLKYAIQ